jgi:hypothetical protein
VLRSKIDKTARYDFLTVIFVIGLPDFVKTERFFNVTENKELWGEQIPYFPFTTY